MQPNTIKIDEVEYVRKDAVKSSDGPIKIVVLDRGFVYIGRVDDVDDFTSDFVTINDAQNIQRWGTTKGLGELANEGPKTNTILNKVGTVVAPSRAVISIISVDQSKWNCI